MMVGRISLSILKTMQVLDIWLLSTCDHQRTAGGGGSNTTPHPVAPHVFGIFVGIFLDIRFVEVR